MMTRSKKNSSLSNVLTIAGSDSGGGAGIQADIKAISANGAYACSVLTAVTAQNTQGVTAIHDVPIDIIAAQIDAVMSDIEIKAVKIGMLSQERVIDLVYEKLVEYPVQHVVLDPIMVATSGDSLLNTCAIEKLKDKLMPLATIITPNLYEAAILSGLRVAKNEAEMMQSAKAILADISESKTALLIKGGHLSESTNSCSSDLLLRANGEHEWFCSERIYTSNTHGTGCSLSSAIAAQLANGKTTEEAIGAAKNYLNSSLKAADQLCVGSGSGPIHLFSEWHD